MYGQEPLIQYKWKPGSRISLPINEAVAEIERQRALDDGVLIIPNFVNRARPEDAFFHSELEWSDAVAAELHREEQARRILRSIVTVYIYREKPEEPEEDIRTYVSVRDARVGNVYVTLTEAMAKPNQREQLLRDAWRDLKTFEHKYRMFIEISDVLRLVKRGIGLIEKKQGDDDE